MKHLEGIIVKNKKFTWLILMAASIALGACGSKDNASNNEEKQVEVETPQSSISVGSKKMKMEVVDLKKHLESNNAEKVKASAENLEEIWQEFEDGVKAKDSTLYEKVETPLHIIEAGAKVKPLDVKTLSKAAVELDDVLTNVEKLK